MEQIRNGHETCEKIRCHHCPAERAQSLDVSKARCLSGSNRHTGGGPVYEVRLVATKPGRTIKLEDVAGRG